ncbi:MAG TPA: YggS family pyridoxal phosphate-dependent enzyme [Solirubrobacteraceae bacterium]|nr:YggS family pyridoxal phosphate-dependent enzyme [Solirubrobacteraceae bacterium]
MAELIANPSTATIAANLAQVRAEIARAARRAGRRPEDVQVLAATKYVALADMPALARAGIELVGENRAQDLRAKVDAYGDTFTWDFIGHLQSRKVRQVLGHVRLIHSVASDSVLRELARHKQLASPEMRVLIEVNVAAEPGKDGVAPAELAAFIERCPVPVAGLMTMPPQSSKPEQSRRWFAALRELAQAHALEHLSMGTTQDYAVAVEEGATIVRIGTKLYA